MRTHLVILTEKYRYQYIGYRRNTITKNMAANTVECNSSNNRFLVWLGICWAVCFENLEDSYQNMVRTYLV